MTAQLKRAFVIAALGSLAGACSSYEAPAQAPDCKNRSSTSAGMFGTGSSKWVSKCQDGHVVNTLLKSDDPVLKGIGLSRAAAADPELRKYIDESAMKAVEEQQRRCSVLSAKKVGPNQTEFEIGNCTSATPMPAPTSPAPTSAAPVAVPVSMRYGVSAFNPT